MVPWLGRQQEGMAEGEEQGAPHKGDFMTKGREEGVGAGRAREAGWSEPVAAEPTGNAEPRRLRGTTGAGI